MPGSWLRVPSSPSEYRRGLADVHASTKFVDRAANATLNAQDSGVIQYVTAGNITLTLPASTANTAGMKMTVVNTLPNNQGNITVAPTSGNMIMGAGYSGANNNGWTLAKANAYPGDMISLQGCGAVGWYVAYMIGEWTYS